MIAVVYNLRALFYFVHVIWTLVIVCFNFMQEIYRKFQNLNCKLDQLLSICKLLVAIELILVLNTHNFCIKLVELSDIFCRFFFCGTYFFVYHNIVLYHVQPYNSCFIYLPVFVFDLSSCLLWILFLTYVVCYLVLSDFTP